MNYFKTKFDIEFSSATESCVVDDSIMIKGSPATAGSKILDSFISPIDAHVVTKLREADVKILGKTKMDEFGAGGLLLKKGTKDGVADLDDDCIVSDSGAVAIVSEGHASFALCNDYSGMVALEAAECGLYYIQPTYGTVSRYGLIPAVQSMDQIGVVCNSPSEGFRALSIISGYDEKDGAMLASDVAASSNEHSIKGFIRIGIPRNIPTLHWESHAAIGYIDYGNGLETVETELVHFDKYKQVMQILCSAELSNNISRYDGIKYGYRAPEYSGLRELYTSSRDILGTDVKLAAMLGAYVLSHDNYEKLYDKAMRIRRIIRDGLEFDKYDAIVLPTPCLARLCGLPAVTMPLMTIAANAGREDVLMSIIGKGE